MRSYFDDSSRNVPIHHRTKSNLVERITPRVLCILLRDNDTLDFLRSIICYCMRRATFEAFTDNIIVKTEPDTRIPQLVSWICWTKCSANLNLGQWLLAATDDGIFVSQCYWGMRVPWLSQANCVQSLMISGEEQVKVWTQMEYHWGCGRVLQVEFDLYLREQMLERSEGGNDCPER